MVNVEDLFFVCVFSSFEVLILNLNWSEWNADCNSDELMITTLSGRQRSLRKIQPNLSPIFNDQPEAQEKGEHLNSNPRRRHLTIHAS